MNYKWGDLQIVDINEKEIFCQYCGADLIDIANYIFYGGKISELHYWKELCKCKKCKNNFILRHNIYDKYGHIYPHIFSEDINNPEYKWQEILTEEQKELIAKHLTNCEICRDRLSQEILSDAWLKSFIENLKMKK